MVSVIGSVLELGLKYIDNSEKREQLALDTVKAMLESKTYKFVDAIVKLAYASEHITKGLIRPLGAGALFVWGILNPEEVAKLKDLGTAGEVAMLGIYGSAPAWGVSRHIEKQKDKESSINDYKG